MGKFEGNAITWFEIPTRDFQRASNFYESLLATRLQPFPGPDPCSMFPVAEGNVGGCIVHRPELRATADGTVVYLNVDGALDATLMRARRMNTRILVPRTQIPGGYGFYACILDSEGNHIGLHSRGD